MGVSSQKLFSLFRSVTLFPPDPVKKSLPSFLNSLIQFFAQVQSLDGPPCSNDFCYLFGNITFEWKILGR